MDSDVSSSAIHSREKIMIASSSILLSPPPSSQVLQPQFRYADHRSTLVIESDRPLSPTYLNRFFTLANVPEGTSFEEMVNMPTALVPSHRAVADITKTRSSQYRHSPHISDSLLSPTSSSESPSPPKSPYQRARILFYHKHDPHYGFTNFSSHPVIYKGKKYPTSEHLFQSFKFQDYRPGLAEHIRTCSERPSVAFSEARRFQPEVRPDWKFVNIAMMDIALEHKFTQHEDLKKELLETRGAELVEDSDKDAFWGVGTDRKGRNELGKALERLRDKLRDGVVT